MALFGKKAKDPASPPTQAEANGATAVATNTGDPAAPPGKKGKAPKAAKPAKAAKPGKPSRSSHAKTLKNGTVVGLNVGNSLIKAVEITCKNGELSVTAMGAVATPPDCISNGVVISVAALSEALKGLWRSAGIKSRNVVTSVAGTGALVVRVIEVPKMTDNELRDNMKVDADRYIPFPPSEVVMDFKALRDLPTDPDAPNMEVLLAAAQREIIDHHLKALQSSRLDPRAIDVEPIAAVRALELARTRALGDNYVDYNDVSAIVNIGATGTEISVLRGDIVVFTRSVPTGGNTITQAIVDSLEVEFHEAERVKIEVADALPPHGVDLSAPQPQDEFDAAFGADFGGFGSQDDTEAIPFDDFGGGASDAGNFLNLGLEDADSPTAAIADPFAAATFGASAFTAPPQGAAPRSAPAAPGTSPAGPVSDDPFDLDFFNQGPKQNEPGAGHGQSEGGGFSFSFEGDPKPEPPAPAPQPAAPEPPPAAPEGPETPHQAGAFTFNFDDATTTSTAFLPTLEERKMVIEPRPPVEPTPEQLLPTLVPARRPENLATPPVIPVVSYSAPSEWDDSSLLPTVDTSPPVSEPDPTGSELLPTLVSPPAAPPAAPAAPKVPSTPVAIPPAPQAPAGLVASAFDFDDQDLPTVSVPEADIPAPLIPGLLSEAGAVAEADSPTEFFGATPAEAAPPVAPAPLVAPAPRGFAFSEPVEEFLSTPPVIPAPVPPAAVPVQPAASAFSIAPAESSETADFESPTQPLNFEGIGALSAARPAAPRQDTEIVPSSGDTEILGGHFDAPTHSLGGGTASSDDFDLDAIFGAAAPAAAPAAPDLGATAGFGAAAGAATGVGATGVGATGFGASGFGTATGAAGNTGLAGALGGLTAAAGGFDLSGLEAGDDGGYGTGADMGSFGVGLASDEDVASVDAGHLYNILHPVLEELVNEVRRSLEYHLSRYPDAAISRIVLIGGGAGLLNLDVFFTQMLGIPTEVSNPFANISLNAPKLPPDYALDNGAICTVALGLALRDFVQ